MGAITKASMKAIKFYKHVVQNVEKFILKCKPEYKIPGLYVIDSIVRQSRHQFGPEKDVFAPRFARNMEETFAHLFRCSQEDKVRFSGTFLTFPVTHFFVILEQNYSRPQPVAEKQCFCTGSDPAAI
jgi:CID domain